MNALDRAYVKHELSKLRAELTREIDASFRAAIGTSRAELGQVERDLNTRIDTVHSRALRELTRQHSKGQTPND